MATDRRESPAGTAHVTEDSEAALQEELRRETAERDLIGGDTATDRHLSGSSTWVTLPDARVPTAGGIAVPEAP